MPPSSPECRLLVTYGPRQVREEASSKLARVGAELHTMTLSHHNLEDELLAALRELLARGDELDKVASGRDSVPRMTAD